MSVRRGVLITVLLVVVANAIRSALQSGSGGAPKPSVQPSAGSGGVAEPKPIRALPAGALGTPMPPPLRAQGPAPRRAPGQRPERHLWFEGCGRTGTSKAGLHNQRQTLQYVALLASAADATLVIGHYAANVHDNRTQLQWGDIFDLPRLRRELPVPVLLWDEAGGRVPEGAAAVSLTAPWLPEAKTDLMEEAQRLRNGPLHHFVNVSHEECVGHPLWRITRSSEATRRWAQELTGRAFRFAAHIRELADRLIATVARVGKTTPDRVHAFHLRVRGNNDFMDWPFSPLMNCSEVFRSPSFKRDYHACEKRNDYPSEASCMCKVGNPKYERFKQKKHSVYLDFDWVIGNASKGGRVRKGDAAFIATNDESHQRVQATRAALLYAGATPVTMTDVLAASDSLRRSIAALPSPVLVGAVEAAACAAAPGIFFPTCLSAVSEYIYDTRASEGDAEAASHHLLNLQILDLDLTTLDRVWCIPPGVNTKPAVIKLRRGQAMPPRPRKLKTVW
eukprot:TRINITY_DN31199_c0_g1_i3.p1 TRINITY_DN31199_c0_g1~~TRINITY_DN31199_c0_g1_i3.p1  ORF type:complete len:544 (+),score=159.43 TRINITY_DN31199_c0_g1_i3:117-1634(+)